MDASEQAAFRDLINALICDLGKQDARGEEAQATVVLDQQAVGRLSRMDALQNQAMARAEATRRAAHKTRLVQALLRIDEGTFGLCKDCDEPIARKRLELDPSLILCIDCAQG